MHIPTEAPLQHEDFEWADRMIQERTKPNTASLDDLLEVEMTSELLDRFRNVSEKLEGVKPEIVDTEPLAGYLAGFTD